MLNSINFPHIGILRLIVVLKLIQRVIHKIFFKFRGLIYYRNLLAISELQIMDIIVSVFDTITLDIQFGYLDDDVIKVTSAKTSFDTKLEL